MGIIAINPEEVNFPGGNVTFKAKPAFFEIGEDLDRFYAFISEVSDLLGGPTPKESKNCQWCEYRLCFNTGDAVTENIPF